MQSKDRDAMISIGRIYLTTAARTICSHDILTKTGCQLAFSLIIGGIGAWLEVWGE